MNDRRQFRFPEEAQSAFGFLTEHGYSCVSTSSHKVKYESRKTYIEVSHGQWDCEVSISFGRLAENEEFSFTLFLRLVNPGLDKALGERLADQPHQVREVLTKLANALKTEGQPIIDCDDSIFERMKSVRWWQFQPEVLRND